jgi:hypothetical protein
MASLDNGDALALTFSYPALAPRYRGRPGRLHRFEYNPYKLQPDEIIGAGGQYEPPPDRADVMHHSEVLRRRAMGFPDEGD